MLSMDLPGKVDMSKKSSSPKMKTSGAPCTTLACQNGVWENDYLTESERRMASESHSESTDLGSPKGGLRTIIGELQAKLTAMKQQFAEIRTRCNSHNDSNRDIT
jgi:hypothetical protein